MLRCAYTICSYGHISNFLHNNPKWITLPTQLWLVLYSFSANFLLSRIMWLIVSSLSPHNLHFLFWCVLFFLALIWLVLMALFCAAFRRDSFSLLRFPFLRHVQVFSWDMLLISDLKRSWSCFSSHFLFPIYCHSVGFSVVTIVSGGSNQSFPALFYAVFESLYRYVNDVFNDGKSSSSLLSWNM